MNIRAARAEDADTIAEFNLRMALETEDRRLDPGRVQAGVRALLASGEKGAYYLAEITDGGRQVIAGQLLITYEWSDWRNGAFWWIQSVFVREEFRGRGIFRSLYQHVHALAKNRADVCGLRLYVEGDNETAQRAYARLGMKPTSYRFFEVDFILGNEHRAA
ncbi:MAG TPA: GNAT family N-acetyltransferase [Verrucomicrobiae bacterium]|nr:GNAT family N-acetyltransferase [Verrucomicrobiae bacterium]